MEISRNSWSHPEISAIISGHLNHQGSSGVIRNDLGPCGFIWFYLGSSGSIWPHMIASTATFINVMCLGQSVQSGVQHLNTSNQITNKQIRVVCEETISTNHLLPSIVALLPTPLFSVLSSIFCRVSPLFSNLSFVVSLL